MADDYNVEKEKSGKLGFLRDEKIRAGIIASVIASLFVILFVKPILDGVWVIIVAISSQIYSGYVDDVYKSAALGPRNNLDFIILFILVFFLVVFSFGTLVFFKDAIGQLKREFLELIGEAPPREEKDMEKFKEEVKKKFKLGKRLLIVMRVTLPIYFLLSFLLITRAFVELQINTSFRQRVAVLAPHISKDQEESLFAQWALMQTRKDYLRITSGMEQMAQELKIKLPKLLID